MNTAALKDESGSVQALRGVACLLLVAFHVIGSRQETGLHVGDESIYRQFAHWFLHLRMPLFTFLSGFVYAYRPVAPGRFRAFAQKKFVRLFLPLVCVSTLYFAVTFVVPGEANGRMPLSDMWRIYVFPYVHFWFLQAVILIFGAVLLLERLRWLATPWRYALVFAVVMVIHLNLDMTDDDNSPFSLKQALYLAPFFLLGLGANRFRQYILRPAVIWTCAVAFVVSMALHALLVGSGYVTPRATALGALIGASGALALLGTLPALAPLQRIGGYSFAIYLFHPFFVAGTRTLLKMLDIGSMELVFVVAAVMGVAGPIALERALGNVHPFSMLLFGRTSSRERAEAADARVGA